MSQIAGNFCDSWFVYCIFMECVLLIVCCMLWIIIFLTFYIARGCHCPMCFHQVTDYFVAIVQLVTVVISWFKRLICDKLSADIVFEVVRHVFSVFSERVAARVFQFFFAFVTITLAYGVFAMNAYTWESSVPSVEQCKWLAGHLDTVSSCYLLLNKFYLFRYYH